MELNKKELECLIDVLEDKIERILDDGQVGIRYKYTDGSSDDLSYDHFINEIRK